MSPIDKVRQFILTFASGSNAKLISHEVIFYVLIMYANFDRIEGFPRPNGAKAIVRIENYARFETSNSRSAVTMFGSERLLWFKPELCFNVVWKLP